MAREVRQQSGGDSLILLGKNANFGSPIDDFSNMIQRRFPAVRNTLGLSPNFIQSESFLGEDSAPPQILSSVNPSGQWEFEILPEDIVHILRWAMNINTDPTNTPVTNVLGSDSIIAAAAAIVNTAVTPATGKDEPSWPSQVRFTFSGSVTRSSSSGADPRIVVIGTTATGQTGGETKVETIRLTADSQVAANSRVSTPSFFRKITSYQLIDVSGGMVAVDFVPDTNEVELELGSTSDGLVTFTSQMRKGLTLFASPNVTLSNMNLTLGANARMALDVQASDIIQNALIDDINTAATAFPSSGDGALSNFPISNLNFARPRGTGVYLGTIGSGDEDTIDYSKPVTTDNVVIGINNNLEEPSGNTAELSAPQPTVGDAGREITLSIEKRYETGDDAYDWLSLFRSSGNVPVAVRNYNFDTTGRQYLIEAVFPYCTFSEAPELPVESRGVINQTLPMTASSTPDGDAAMIARIWSKTGFSNGNGR